MNIIFHYYALYFLCSRAGCPEQECDNIARSSQYVDESINQFEILSGGKSWRGVVTQDYIFWDERILKNVYIPFHFFPGNPEEASEIRIDKKINPGVVTANSLQARELLVNALKTNDAFRIGIALHTFADTWAHQNFSGKLEDFNIIGGNKILPPVGHLCALTKPDEYYTVWRDDRLINEVSMIRNKTRYLEAAKRIYRYLRTRRRESFEDEEFVLSDLSRILDSGSDRASISASFIIEGNVVPYESGRWFADAGIDSGIPVNNIQSGYDKVRWLKAHAEQTLGLHDGTTKLVSDGRYLYSDLHHWHEAAKEHIMAAQKIIDIR